MDEAEEVQRVFAALGCFLFLCYWPKASDVSAKGLLQDDAWECAVGKSGQGLFGAGLGVGIEWRRLWPVPKSGCSASETRGSGDCLFVICIYFLWHKL